MCLFSTLKKKGSEQKNSSRLHPPTWPLSEEKGGGAKPLEIFHVTGNCRG